MNRAQGGTRSLPDGFLHIQNFTVTKASGMAGCVWAYILTEAQREIVELVLVERAESREAHKGFPEGTLVHLKHDHFRFRKDFLKGNFRSVVHEVTKAMHTPVIENFKTKLFAERESL
ncbi:hypothetical protein X917_gp20 [Pseudomonas phage PPpW-4]|uniref:Uncharacterized protein n=1 Tax=Pseudomonas phage PPpW-4 TaxID=1279083 RepID=V5YUV1_9CAUD|nr:hypothetical protein X917_gp20 [Pseudomonas phage PPpW-4]BAO20686.1 hypothetical protein [Pseudomonas phage PPpW-4]